MSHLLKKYWKHIVLAVIIVFAFAITYYSSTSTISVKNEQKLATIKKSSVKKEEKAKEPINTLFVDVKGSVNNPGVYELEDNKRVIDAINKAGGLTNNADTINLNLSKKLEDEMIVIVYSKVEIANYYKQNGTKNASCASLECSCPDDFNDACITNNKNTTKKTNTEKELTGKVSINNASKEELMTLTGIGSSKADKIISYRQENGKFNSLEDIKNVSGIGDALYEKIKNNIEL